MCIYALLLSALYRISEECRDVLADRYHAMLFFTPCSCHALATYITCIAWLKEGYHLASSVNVSVLPLIMITIIHV